MKITIECQLEPRDYINAQYLNMRPRPFFKYAGIVVLILFAGIFVKVLQVSIANAKMESSAWIFVAILLFFSWYFCVAIPRAAKRIFRQQKNLQMPYTATITDDALHIVSESGNKVAKWTELHKYRIGRDMILLYYSDVMIEMFPRRWFSGAEFDEFKTCLFNALGKPEFVERLRM